MNQITPEKKQGIETFPTQVTHEAQGFVKQVWPYFQSAKETVQNIFTFGTYKVESEKAQRIQEEIHYREAEIAEIIDKTPPSLLEQNFEYQELLDRIEYLQEQKKTVEAGSALFATGQSVNAAQGAIHGIGKVATEAESFSKVFNFIGLPFGIANTWQSIKRKKYLQFVKETGKEEILRLLELIVIQNDGFAVSSQETVDSKIIRLTRELIELRIKFLRAEVDQARLRLKQNYVTGGNSVLQGFTGGLFLLSFINPIFLVPTTACAAAMTVGSSANITVTAVNYVVGQWDRIKGHFKEFTGTHDIDSLIERVKKGRDHEEVLCQKILAIFQKNREIMELLTLYSLYPDLGRVPVADILELKNDLEECDRDAAAAVRDFMRVEGTAVDEDTLVVSGFRYITKPLV